MSFGNNKTEEKLEKLKQYAFNSYPSFIKKLDNFIQKNGTQYKDRTQFIIQAAEEKLEREDITNE